MPLLVRMGAMMTCSFGAAPATLAVLDPTTILEDAMPGANISDFAPMVNIPTFGMCNSIANPTVAAATAAALGVLTPMPCIPATSAPWVPGAPTTLLRNMPALDQTCKCLCMWGGAISISMPGATKTLD
ncbi:MAG: DUF4280 domain-containing protein [Planctomycetota bacterium]|jgi:hypothetical protein